MLNEDSNITLRGSDDVKVECSVRVCGPSEFLQNQIEDSENADFGEIVVPKVTGSILEHIVKYLNHYADTPMEQITHPIEGTTIEEVRSESFSLSRGNRKQRETVSNSKAYSLDFLQVVTQEWYAKFITEMPENDVYKLLLAANFMHIQPLLDLVVIRIAWLFSKKSPDEVCFFDAWYDRLRKRYPLLTFLAALSYTFIKNDYLVEEISQLQGTDQGARRKGPRWPPVDFREVNGLYCLSLLYRSRRMYSMFDETLFCDSGRNSTDLDYTVHQY